MNNSLMFTESHEWIRDNEDGTVTLGISEYAQKMLGDVVFVELPEVDSEIEAGDSFSLVESVKAASDIYTPITGRIVEVNEDLENNPELINTDPYENGWIVRIEMFDSSELMDLISSDEYLDNIDEE